MADEFGTSQRNKILEMPPQGGAKRDRDLAQFVAYWTSMRRGNDVPLRTEIDPRGIEALLGNAFIAEKIAPGLARLRIAGAHLADVMGMEVRGMPLSALIEPEDRQQLADAIVELFEGPAQIRIELASPGGIRRAPMTATLLILPLRSDLGDISRALGCFVSNGSIGATPRRFRVVSSQVERIDLTAEKKAKGFAEAQAPLAAKKPDAQPQPPRSASERSYLRLVHSE
ncbi:MAG: PAS domain-containing protein [Pseudomonadota bacterium]